MTTKITTDNILDGTIDAVDMKDSAITNAKLAGSIDVTSKLTGSVPTTNLPTIPVSKGGTGLTSVGDAGQVVQVNSGGSALEFADAAGGGLIHLNTTTVDNAASIIYDNSLITSSHDVYKIVYSNYVPVTTDTTLRLQVSTDNGSNFLNVLISNFLLTHCKSRRPDKQKSVGEVIEILRDIYLVTISIQMEEISSLG